MYDDPLFSNNSIFDLVGEKERTLVLKKFLVPLMKRHSVSATISHMICSQFLLAPVIILSVTTSV